MINSGFIIKFSFLIYSALSIFLFLGTWDLQGLGPQLLWLRYICKESEIIFCKNEPWCLIFCISTEKPLVHLSRSAAPIFPYPPPLPALSYSLSRYEDWDREWPGQFYKIFTLAIVTQSLRVSGFHSKLASLPKKSAHPPLPYFYPSIFLFHKMQSKMKSWCPNLSF